ncbi:MAG: hypothetical protein CLLPBCKN_008594 [Chroococcidiopsis cubana SAG 39.79]|nr:hypothetical protein [Chroococcidiopsis cubana]MDZ4879156.1 hypothetical protein [Chroococcidiopsis cubana SAG 39.79]
MPVSKESNLHRENRLLAALPTAEYQRLLANLELVELQLKQVLYAADGPITHVYFPHHSITSLIYTFEDGLTNEVGVVGNEGMVGLPVILGGNTTTTSAIVQVANGATRMGAAQFKAEFNRGGPLQELLLRYTQDYLLKLHKQLAATAIIQ